MSVRLLASAAAGCVTAALLVATAPTVYAAPRAAAPSPAAHTSGIGWGTCRDATLQRYGAECGLLSVPLDYAHPKGARIQLAVSRVKHTVPDSQYQGVILVNPGGPGGSGLIYAIYGPIISKSFKRPDVGNAYDWVGFDPRGVGSSVPALSCDPNYFGPNRPEYIPFRKKLEQTWLKRSANYANACGKAGGELLRHMTTVDSARDMDSIRAALGRKQINYLGFSYGTYLAQVYTKLFPSHMRRMVLDSNVDARKVWYQANLEQDIAFERNMNIWFGWLAKYDSVYHLGTTAREVRHTWYGVKNSLRKHPIEGIVGPDEWTDVFLYAGYYQSTWLELADVFAGWVNKQDGDAVVNAYKEFDGPGDDNGFAVYNAVQCTDVQWPQNWSTWRRDNWRVYKIAPFFTWGNVWFNAPCLFWPAPAKKPLKITGKGVGSALLIDETLDAATPYPGSLYLRSIFKNSVLVAEPGGTTHAGSLAHNACVDDKIFDYFAKGVLPPRKPGRGADVYCAPLPQPVPEGASPQNSAAANSAPAAAAERKLLADLVRAIRR